MSDKETSEEIPDIDMPPHNIAHPRATRGVIGQGAAETQFITAMQSGRLAHAWILHGPSGVGKATFAYHVARQILSVADAAQITEISTPPETQAANLVEQGAHPDLFVLKRIWDLKAKKFFSVVRVDDARELQKSLQQTASHGGWRVAIIDSLDEMNKNAANSLLKSLEEPPPRVLFLMVCHQLGAVLDTIRSRSQVLRFNVLEAQDCHNIVASHFPDLPTGDISLAVFLGGGSAARACRIADSDGYKIYTDLMSLLATMPQMNVQELHDMANLASNRSKPENFILFCDLLSGWVHRFVRTQSSGAIADNTPQVEAQILNNWHARIPQSAMLDFWKELQAELKTLNSLNLDKKQAALVNLEKINAIFK